MKERTVDKDGTDVYWLKPALHPASFGSYAVGPVSRFVSRATRPVGGCLVGIAMKMQERWGIGMNWIAHPMRLVIQVKNWAYQYDLNRKTDRDRARFLWGKNWSNIYSILYDLAHSRYARQQNPGRGEGVFENSWIEEIVESIDALVGKKPSFREEILRYGYDDIFARRPPILFVNRQNGGDEQNVSCCDRAEKVDSSNLEFYGMPGLRFEMTGEKERELAALLFVGICEAARLCPADVYVGDFACQYLDNHDEDIRDRASRFGTAWRKNKLCGTCYPKNGK